MSQNFAGKLEEILEKLKKLNVIESPVKNIEAKLKSLEERTDVLENFRQTAEKDIYNDLKDGANFTSAQLNEQTIDLAKTQAELTELKKTVKTNEEGMKEAAKKLLYLEAYSRRENIRFMNIAQDGQTEEPENVEETLRTFLQRDLDYLDVGSVEIQRVHRNGKAKDGNTRPILARFLRYKVTWAPIERHEFPNVPRLPHRNCQMTQRTVGNLQRG